MWEIQGKQVCYTVTHLLYCNIKGRLNRLSTQKNSQSYVISRCRINSDCELRKKFQSLSYKRHFRGIVTEDIRKISLNGCSRSVCSVQGTLIHVHRLQIWIKSDVRAGQSEIIAVRGKDEVNPARLKKRSLWSVWEPLLTSPHCSALLSWGQLFGYIVSLAFLN